MGGGGLPELRPYWLQLFASLAYGKRRDLPRVLNVLLLLPIIEKFQSFILPKNAGMLQHSIIHSFIYQMVTYDWLKTKESFKFFLALKEVMVER